VDEGCGTTANVGLPTEIQEPDSDRTSYTGIMDNSSLEPRTNNRHVPLDPEQAQRLVDQIMKADSVEEAVEACRTTLAFLIQQLHSLGDQANGYPKNSIDGNVWAAGQELTWVCDRYADAVGHWNQRKGEEQATRLATTMAMQVVSHYPEEIFPRVLRNAKCCESLKMNEDAITGYRCIVQDFVKLELEGDLDEPLEAFQKATVSATCEALAGLDRLSQDGLSVEEQKLHARLNELLARQPSNR
jgi:hypothetical protein